MKSKLNLKPGAYTLVVVAHPDDETLFFGATIRRAKGPVHVICVTDGNADGRGETRRMEFQRSTLKLGAQSTQFLLLPDIYSQRLNVKRISDAIQSLPRPKTVYTHGPLGEYGHPHHQDTCAAVHEALPRHPKLFGVAYNAFPDLSHALTAKEFALKAKLMSETYFDETKRFIHFIPLASTENFCRYSLAEVRAVYAFLAGHSSEVTPSALKKLRWFSPYLQEFKTITGARPF